jgi:nitroimidazol reductase NimA-like FMN-containing flavoprotein (pyridoxamine 5'-phosphate oxidase superfamily)
MSEQRRSIPTLDRPQMPQGYGVPDNDEGLLPWEHAREQLARALTYWIGSTRPDGRPHAMPIWGAVVDDTVYFEGSPETRRGRNLAANPAVVVHIENGPEVVILEGTAEMVTALDPALSARLVDAFAAKYEASFGYRPDPAQWEGGGLYAVRAQVGFAWNTFPATTTRYRFGKD